MARTSIAVASPATNSDAIVTKTNINPAATGANGYVVTSEIKDHSFAMAFNNSGSATGPVWIKASDAMLEMGQGDITITVGGDVTKVAGPFEGCRVRQSNGDINIDSGITGTAWAVQLP